MTARARPTGLLALGIINFVLAAICFLWSMSYICAYYIGVLRATSMAIEGGDVGGLGGDVSYYAVLSPLLTGILLTISGIGFFKVSYRWGYIGGNVFAVLSLINVLLGGILLSGSPAAHVPSMIYPIVLLVLLNGRYRKVFRRRAT